MKLDLQAVPFRDRLAVQIMASILKPELLDRDSLVAGAATDRLCRRVPVPNSGGGTKSGWSVCPVGPGCRRNLSEQQSAWFHAHTWDFCTQEGAG